MVLKEVIFNSFYFWWVWQSLNNGFLTVSIFGGCGGPERGDFKQFLLFGGCGGLQSRWIFNSFYTLGGCGGPERGDF